MKNRNLILKSAYGTSNGDMLKVKEKVLKIECIPLKNPLSKKSKDVSK